MNIFEGSRSDFEICMQFEKDYDRFYGAVIPPTFGNTLFVFPDHEELGEAVADERYHYVYWRGTNPTVEIVENILAQLERGEQCKCFASGMAAISAAIFNSVSAGDHVLCVSHIYKSTLDLTTYMKKWGVEHSTVYSTITAEIEAAIKPNTKLIYIENPTDITYELVDIKAIARIAKSRGIRTILDNTWATPLFQKPLTHGIDIVVHSASKYLGGHNDLMGGALVTSKELMRTIFTKEYQLVGGCMGPREASLLLRGLRTLPFRMKAHQESTMKVAGFLTTHPAVARVHYPGLNQDNASRLSGYSGLLSFELKEATYAAVKKVINKVKIFKIGVSYGSFESMIFSLNVGTNEEKLKRDRINAGLIRIFVGMEPVEQLIADLRQALGEV